MLHFLKLLPSNRCFIILMTAAKRDVIKHAEAAIAAASFMIPKDQWETVEYMGFITPEYSRDTWLLPTHRGPVASIELQTDGS